MRLLLSVGVLLLGACALVPNSAHEAALRERPQNARMHADLVRGMMASRQYYAALAHIEELQRAGASSAAELSLLRGQCLYQLGRLDAAAGEFERLLQGRYAGQALHGLGLVHVRWNLADAVRYFNAAIRLRPTDAELRNDLGYALLMAGRLAEARHHLATASELDPGGLKASNNLILSYLVDGDDATAKEIAATAGLAAEELLLLRREASLLRDVIRARSGEFSASAG